MLKERVTYQCSECHEEIALRVPKNQDWDMFVEDKECPECGCTCLEVSEN